MADPDLPILPRSATSRFSVLVFSRTEGYRHESIEAGIAALKDLAMSSHDSPVPFHVDATEDAIVFNPATLAQYQVVVFLQASGEFFDNGFQLDALKQFVRAGGGVVGIHCASAGLPSSEWYGRLIGAVFTGHPAPQDGTVAVEDPAHPILAHGTALPRKGRPLGVLGGQALEFGWHDEWYNFATNPRSQDGVHVLLTVRESTYEGGSMGADHPVAWCHEFEGGRVFYTALGHFDEAYQDLLFMGQVINAIIWAARVV
ncbi:putative glycosyl hydrolase [Diaporthe ampelina]|uniref:Putative glycosyl hydrolase n=1 Tax=Diaporthe ampelina TaxID=1214573 RepID=A0A0G2HX30_9PEZI|nr:putative glycosyl hydrolase [Diaporthe ampelina]